MRDDSDLQMSWLSADRNTVRRQDVSDLAIYELGYTMGVSYDFMTGGECEACGNAVSESCIGDYSSGGPCSVEGDLKSLTMLSAIPLR